MALRYQNSHKAHDRVPSYYVENKLYPGSYVHNDYQTRTPRRVHDGLSLDKNYGIDTISDDVDSSAYSSPYYINGRFNSSNLVTQRGDSASVQGMSKLMTINDEIHDFTTEDQQTVLEMWQGKQIKFELPFNGRVVGNTISVKNTGGCTGVLSIYISDRDGGIPIYETAIDLCQISEDKFDHKTLYSTSVIERNQLPRGKLFVRMEIWDEISSDKTVNPFNTGNKIEIAATGMGGHYEAVVKMTEKNMPVVEQYTYTKKPNRPLMGLIYNQYHSVPVNRNDLSGAGATVTKNNYKYDIFCIGNDSEAKVVIYDRQMNRIIDSNIKVDSRTKGVNLAQVEDRVYYVDGYSPLQKFTVGEWNSTALPIAQTDEDAHPVDAPAFIIKHHNRIYITGFRYDRNLLQYTEIGEHGPVWESFVYRQYIPDQSAKETSTNPITSINEFESNTLMITGKSFYSLYTTDGSAKGTVESGYAQQVSMYTDGGGVQSAGDICNYHGVMYSFDQDEGIRRFNGSLWEKIPQSLDSHVERVDMTQPRKMWGYARKLYFNYLDKVDGEYKCMVWDMDMNYQQYPWFQDVDVPFCDVRTDDNFDLVGIHPDYPCIMNIYAENTWRRLDSPIVFERHTKYISLPGNASDMILKRVHNKVLANANRWWWFGLSFDKHALTQNRNKVITYRLPCWDTIDVARPVEETFNEQDIYEQDSVALLTISNVRVKCISVQERIRCKTFRDQASLISTLFEAQPSEYL